MTIKISGSCLCDEVQFTVTGPFQLFVLCHCSRCRKSTGSAHASNIFTEAVNIEWISGAELVNRYELPDAKRFTKAFCLKCGCPVPCVSRDDKRLLIPAGSLDSNPDINPHMRIYCADKAPWYEQIETVRSFDGAAT